MILDFDKNVTEFLAACNRNNVKMLMVGGGAVNFHGYQRHSADLDFWIDNNSNNLLLLKNALLEIGFEEFNFPLEVRNGLQNISIKISPITDLELITNFNPGRSFEEVWSNSLDVEVKHVKGVTYKVIPLADLINSKVKSGRNKDLLDIQELKRINKLR